MRKHITILIIFFLVSQSSSQEIISNITTVGNEQRHILEQVDGTPYLVKISWLDSLYTYDISETQPILLHTSHSEGVFKHYNLKNDQNWLLFVNGAGALAYDFVDDEYINYPNDIEDEDVLITNSLWQIWDHGYFTLTQIASDFSISRVLLMDSDLTAIDSSFVFENLKSVSDKNFIIKNETETNIYYSSIDRMTFEQTNDLVLNNDEIHVVDGKNLVYTKDSNTELWRYDFDIDNDSLLYVANTNFTEQNIAQTDNHFIYTQSTQDSVHTITINKSNLEITHFPKIDLGSNNSRSLGSSILYTKVEFNDSIYIYNFETQSTSTYSSIYNASQILRIDQRYILTNNGQENILYDSYDGSFEPFDINIPFLTSLNVKAINLENEILIDLGSRIEEVHDLISIDLDNEQISNSFVVPFTNRGLVDYPQFYTTDTDIFVLNDGILHTIIDDSLYRLVDHPIVRHSNVAYKEVRGGIFWAEKNDTDINFYLYKEEIKKLLATIKADPLSSKSNFDPQSFILGNTHLHIYGQIGLENALTLIDIQSKNTEIIENPAYIPSSRSFFHDGYYYYKDGFYNIQIVDELGNLQIPNFETEDLSFSNFIINNELCFMSDKNGIYRIEGLEAIKMYDLPGVGFNDPFFKKVGPFLTLEVNDNEFIYKDEQWHPLNGTPFGYFYFLNNQYLLEINTFPPTQPASRLYDIDTGNFKNLPQEIDSLRIIGLLKNNETEYLLTLEESYPKYIIKVFEMSSDFTETTLVNSFPVNGQGINGTFSPYKNEGLLFANKDLLLMTKNLDFILLEGIIGDNPFNEIVEKDGTFYFFASDPNKGRQIYKVVAFSKVLDIEKISWAKVNVYPNPTQNNINWNKENSAKNRVQIHDQNGKLVLYLSEFNANSIDISMLQIGIYYINIVDSKDQKVKTGRFMKI
ncbi:MAG: hypothetical protein ACI86M_002981 [Saprospiraceae bacterium]|jgi:hypothetical protein